MKGKKLIKVKAWLCKVGSPNTSGTIRLGVMSGTGSGSTKTWVTDAYVDIQNLISGESTSGAVTLNTGFPATAVPIEITLPTPHTLAENEPIALGLTGGNYSSSNCVAWNYSDGNAVYDGSNTSRNRFTGGSDPDHSGGSWTGSGMASDMHCTLTCKPIVDEKVSLGTTVYSSGLGTSADITTSGAGTLSGATGSGGPFTSGSELQTGCFDFNGSTRVRTGNLQLIPRSDFTFAFWTKADSFSTSGSNSPRWLHADGNTAIIELGNNSNPKIVNFQISTASGTNALEVAHGMSTGTWYHWAFVYDASNGDMIIYRDGSAIGTDTSNPYSLPINAHTSWWEMGGGGSEYMDGQMNDIAIWNKKLPATGTNSIATLYGNGTSTVKRATSVDKENIVAYWDGSDATLTVPNQAIPTTTYDLPENSVFEETDTIKYYFLQDNVWEESPKPYYETSFTSSSSEWSFNDSGKMSIDTSGGTLDFDVVRDGSNDAGGYDLGEVITSTKWKLRCSFKFTANVSSGGNVGAGNGFYFGLSDKSHTTGQNTSQDYIGAQVYRDNQDTLGGIDCDGAVMPRIYDGEDEHSIDIGNTTTTYYMQVQRTSSSAYNVKLWTGGYDGTLVGDASCSNSSGITGLRYIKIQNADTQNISTSSDMDIEVYEVKFWE